jgi:UDP-glucose 6-dehydrogenase
MKIGIIGAGRLGLTFALLCEKNGYEVIVSDVREDYVFNLNQKICLTNEPLIQSMLLDSKILVQQLKILRLLKTLMLFLHSLQPHQH